MSPYLFLFSSLTLCVFSTKDKEYQGPSSRLTRFLEDRHQRSAPPDGLVQVHHEMELVHIVALDELKQTMRVLVYIVQEWNDDSLRWNPDQFDGLTETWLPVDTIWVPDVIVFNMLDHTELLHSVRTPARIDNYGRVTYSYPAIYSVMCTIRIGMFPFDDQNCALRIASWGYSEDKIQLNASSKGVLEHYSCNEEWKLTGVGIENSHYEHEGTIISEVRYVISVGRKPLYYMITLVLPSYIICILSVAGLFARFSTKNEREERFTLGVTAILTMAVLSLVVAEKAPHSSEEVPLMVVYFHFNIIVVTVATICTSSVMKIHWKGMRRPEEPPRWLLSVLLIKQPRSTVVEIEEVRDEQPINSSVRIINGSEKWASVSRRIDYILASIFVILITIPTIYMFWRNAQRSHLESPTVTINC